MKTMHGRKPVPALATALPTLLAIAVLPIALAACQQKGGDNNLDTLDNELADRSNAANGRDPAVVNALQDQIMVDPQLAQQGNQDAVRPPARPYAAPTPGDAASAARAPVGGASSRHAPAADVKAGCPQCRAAQGALTLGALASRQRDRGTANCGPNIQYSNAWANRLPADVPLYPDARVTEAAGNSAGGCSLRVVSFATSAGVQNVIDWYYARVTKAGFSAEHQADGSQHVLGGTRQRDSGAYVIYISPRSGGGADVDLVTNNGR